MLTKIKITLTRVPEPCDAAHEDAACEMQVSGDMSDADVHAWFALFEAVLRYQSFSDDVIAEGACSLAFNGFRDQQIMQTMYDKYDLEAFCNGGEGPVAEYAPATHETL